MIEYFRDKLIISLMGQDIVVRLLKSILKNQCIHFLFYNAYVVENFLSFKAKKEVKKKKEKNNN